MASYTSFRTITWNIHGANGNSPVWELLLEMRPDLALLQEVGSIPAEIETIFKILKKQAIRKTGQPQNFSTAVLVKGEIINEIHLSPKYDEVNRELGFFGGNIVSCVA